MRILHVVPTYLPAVRYGGPIYSVHSLCKALVALGHEVHVYTTSVDGEKDSEVPLGQPVNLDGVQVWYFPSRHLRRLYYSPPLLRMLKKEVRKFDIVHLHSVFLWPTWAAARTARQCGIPYILTPRGMLVNDLVQRKSRWLKICWIKLIEQKNIERAALVHLTSSRELDELEKFSFQAAQTAVIPNGVDGSATWEKNELRADVQKIVSQPDYVLFFGRINWEKGIDRLIRIWKNVPKVRLIVAGNDEEGYLQQLQQIAKEEQVEARITFLARSISGADKEALFAAARLFVLPSYSENFGITVLEAMIRKIPIIVTEEVGAAEIVRKSGAGKVVIADNLGQEIAAILADDKELSVMAQCGYEHVVQQYSWDRIGKRMEHVYCDIVIL